MRRAPDLTDNARRIFDLRYARKDGEGNPVEEPAETVWRVASNVASVTALYEEDENATGVGAEDVDLSAFPYRTVIRQYEWLRSCSDTDRAGVMDAQSYDLPEVLASGWGPAQDVAQRYHDLLSDLRFLPNSPTWTGAGTPLSQLAACYVLPIEDDLGKTRGSIFEILKVAALIQQTGGGNGFDFSRLRPNGALVRRSMGRASGPVAFMEAYDAAFRTMAQGGTRRGANMGVLRVDHPDIREFIRAKTVEGRIDQFNISVAVTDDFMVAVDKDEQFDLVHDGTVYDTIWARNLYEEIVQSAWVIGDPGNLFIDRANVDNPNPLRYTYEATNPCVSGNTLVLTPQGWRRADSIVEGDIISTVFGSGEVERVEVYTDRPVFKVQFSDGGEVRATAAHQFHVRGSQEKFYEERSLDKIEVGDFVRVSMTRAVPDNPVPQPMSDLPDRDFGFLVGALVGDGSYTQKSLDRNVVTISSHVDEDGWNDALFDVLRPLGIESMSRDESKISRGMKLYPRPNPTLARWVKASLLVPAKSPDKVLPEEYVNSNEDFLRGLVDGLISTDGSVNLRSNHPQVRFHTSSGVLAEQMRSIMLMFGIHARIHESDRVRHDIEGREIRHDRPKYDVTISGVSFGRFVEEFSLTHPDKQARMREATKWCNHTGGNYAAKVVSIQSDGMETVYDLFEPESDTWITNGYVSRGCGEQWLPGFGNCCLGSIALDKFAAFKPKGEMVTNEDIYGTFDWEGLKATVWEATRFLDDVLDANGYVPVVPELEEAAQGDRRIGLGGMGLADAMAKMGIRYGSVQGQEFASQVQEFMRYHAMIASIQRAADRGPFEWIEESIYDPDLLAEHGEGAEVEVEALDGRGVQNLTLWKRPMPAPHIEHTTDFGRPHLDWDALVVALVQHGIRNATQFTWAPTGTISNVAGLNGSGCEPFFALDYARTVMQEGQDIRLSYLNNLFAEALERVGVSDQQCEKILAKVKEHGTCQDVFEVPEVVRDVFVVAGDIIPEEHVKMQAALQAFVDNSISKTINMPNEATTEDVSRAYRLAYDLGCKGITIYRQGSRNLEVLATQASDVRRGPVSVEGIDWVETSPLSLPDYVETEGLASRTHKVVTPQGTMWATITELDDHPGRPFDVRLQVGKAGNDKLADIEALGRSVSLALRGGVSVGHVVEQLEGIGGQSVIGFGPRKVRSAADGLATTLRRLYIDDQGKVEVQALPEPVAGEVDFTRVCPSCQNATLVFESGCLHCEPRLGGCGGFTGCE